MNQHSAVIPDYTVIWNKRIEFIRKNHGVKNLAKISAEQKIHDENKFQYVVVPDSLYEF